MKEINNRIETGSAKVSLKEILRSFTSIVKKGGFSKAENSLYKMSVKERNALLEAQKVVKNFKPNSGPRFQYHIDEAKNYRRKIKY